MIEMIIKKTSTFIVLTFIFCNEINAQNVQFTYNKYTNLAKIYSNTKSKDSSKIALKFLDSAFVLNCKKSADDFLCFAALNSKIEDDSSMQKGLIDFFSKGYKVKEIKRKQPRFYHEIGKNKIKKIYRKNKNKKDNRGESFAKKISVIRIFCKDVFFRRWLKFTDKRDLKVKKRIERYLKKYGNLPNEDQVGELLEDAFISVIINHQTQYGELKYINEYLKAFQKGDFFNFQKILWIVDRYSINEGFFCTLEKNPNDDFYYIKVETKQEFFNKNNRYKSSFGFLHLYKNKQNLIVPVFDTLKVNANRKILGYLPLDKLNNYSDSLFTKSFGEFNIQK